MFSDIHIFTAVEIPTRSFNLFLPIEYHETQFLVIISK
jgi:hypothetical protein